MRSVHLLPHRTRCPRRAGAWLASLVLALLAAAGVAAEPATLTAKAELSIAEGPVEIGRGEPPRWTPARAGEPLAVGDAVRTGAGGRAELVLGERTVRLYEQSVLRIGPETGPAGPKAVDLERGRSLFDVIKSGLADGFMVRTPEVVVSVKGTRFQVGAGEAAPVSVFRGTVALRESGAPTDSQVLVRQGFSAVGTGEGSFDLMLSTFDDPWDAWAQGAVAPAPRMADGAAERLLEEAVEAELERLAEEQTHLAAEELEPEPAARAVPAAADEVAIDPVMNVVGSEPSRGDKASTQLDRDAGDGSVTSVILSPDADDDKDATVGKSEPGDDGNHPAIGSIFSGGAATAK